MGVMIGGMGAVVGLSVVRGKSQSRAETSDEQLSDSESKAIANLAKTLVASNRRVSNVTGAERVARAFERLASQIYVSSPKHDLVGDVCVVIQVSADHQIDRMNRGFPPTNPRNVRALWRLEDSDAHFKEFYANPFGA